MGTLNGFEKTASALQNLHNLSKDETLVLLRIIQKGNVKATDIGDILEKNGLGNSVSRPYQILNNLESKRVIFEDTSSNVKSYKAIHPRHLLLELKEDWDQIEKEISLLEQSKEIPDFDKEDPANESMILKSEGLLITTLNELVQKGYELLVYLDKEVQSLEFKKKIEKFQFSSGLTLMEGKLNVILIENKKKEKYGVVLISKRADKKGKQSFFGSLTMDKVIYDFMKKEVKK
ncbi:MAG TPA: hypothetical protein VJB94_00415 [Candidatus Nanoarchaeia archaeon]|nr:hypothetical protein [Candidatus Nanoarchaeia archaeon]